MDGMKWEVLSKLRGSVVCLLKWALLCRRSRPQYRYEPISWGLVNKDNSAIGNRTRQPVALGMGGANKVHISGAMGTSLRKHTQ